MNNESYKLSREEQIDETKFNSNPDVFEGSAQRKRIDRYETEHLEEVKKKQEAENINPKAKEYWAKLEKAEAAELERARKRVEEADSR